MLILLIGPKGSGKSHIGRLLESALNIHFLHVEPLWMKYYAECREARRDPSIIEGVHQIHPAISAALGNIQHVCVETTGASREILDDLISRGGVSDTLLVKVSAPLSLCLERIQSREQENQIPMDEIGVRTLYEMAQSLNLPYDLTFENTTLAPEEIVQSFREAFRNHKEA